MIRRGSLIAEDIGPDHIRAACFTSGAWISYPESRGTA